jgi:hypothetical protein
MLDHVDYIIEGDGYQGNGNGYNHLNGDWGLFYKVAKGFRHRVKPYDGEDFLHDLMLVMAKVKVKYQAEGKELTEAGLKRVAMYEVSEYWRKHYRLTNGIDCGSCSQNQRQKCKDDQIYSECPKAIKMERLDSLIEDGNGGKTELHEMIADDHAIDVVAMLEARFTLQSYPRQAVLIAYKRYAGYPLGAKEQRYLSRFRRRLQKTLL